MSYVLTEDPRECTECAFYDGREDDGIEGRLCYRHHAEETGLYVLDWDCPRYAQARNVIVLNGIRKGHPLRPVPGSSELHYCEACRAVVMLPEEYRG